MRVFSVEVILYDVYAQVKRRDGRTGDFDLARCWVLGCADGRGKGWIVNGDGTERDGDPAVRFVEVALTDLRQGSGITLECKTDPEGSLRRARVYLCLPIWQSWKAYTSHLGCAGIVCGWPES